jgi:hypothetical protein
VADAISWGDVRIAAVIDWAGEVPDAIGLLPATSRADSLFARLSTSYQSSSAPGAHMRK